MSNWPPQQGTFNVRTNTENILELMFLSLNRQIAADRRLDYKEVPNKCMKVYLSGQLKTFVAIVISVVHFVVPLSQNHPPNHHSQVNTLRPKVKLFDLRTKSKKIFFLCGINWR